MTMGGDNSDKRLYGRPGDENLEVDIDEFVQNWLDQKWGDEETTKFIEFSVYPSRHHLPTVTELLESLDEWVAMYGEVTENFELGGGQVDTDAAELFLDTVAGNITFLMANETLATHTITVVDFQPYLDGEPWGNKLEDDTESPMKEEKNG